MTRREIAFVSGITVLGGALRSFQIGAQSLWLDEVFSVLVARRDWSGVLTGTALGDTNPPLFNLLLHVAMQLGSDEVAARAISLLFSVATIPIYYALARLLFNIHVALVATLFLALNPLHVFYAQEARMYALLVFLVLASMFFLLRAWRDGRVRDWVGFWLLTSLAFYTHSLAFMYLLALDVYALVVIKPRTWRPLIIANAAVLIAFVPWLFVLAQQATRVQVAFWAGAPSPVAFVTTAYLFLFSNIVSGFLFPAAFFAMFAAIAFAFVAAIRAIVRHTSDSQALYFAISIFLVPVVLLYLLSFVRPIYVERTLLPASLGLYLLLAWTVVRAEPLRLNRLLAAIILFFTLAALTNYYFNLDTRKPAMREAARALAIQVQPGDVIAHTSDSSALAFAYYAPALSSRFIAGDPDYVNETTRGQTGRIAGLVPEDFQAIVAGHSRLWLVVALDHNESYQKARVAELDARWRRNVALEVGKIALIQYEIVGS